MNVDESNDSVQLQTFYQFHKKMVIPHSPIDMLPLVNVLNARWIWSSVTFMNQRATCLVISQRHFSWFQL